MTIQIFFSFLFWMNKQKYFDAIVLQILQTWFCPSHFLSPWINIERLVRPCFGWAPACLSDLKLIGLVCLISTLVLNLSLKTTFKARGLSNQVFRLFSYPKKKRMESNYELDPKKGIICFNLVPFSLPFFTIGWKRKGFF